MSESTQTAKPTFTVLDQPEFTTTDTITVPGVPFQPNSQQQNLLRWARDFMGSLNLIARAGTGKSTALMLLVRFIVSLFHPKFQYPRIYMGAFNKAISAELDRKMGSIPGVEIGTMHSLGMKLCKNILPGRVELDSRKVSDLARKLAPWNKKYAKVLTQLVGYAKQSGFGVKGCPSLRDKQAWTDMADHYDIWDEVPGEISPERLFNDAYKIYNQSLALCQSESRIDFDDMILVPLMFGGEYKPEIYDWVLLDEAQDTNQVRRMLAMLVLKTGGRMVAVGDDRQAIYGFAGASHDSMSRIKQVMKSAELPLTITYRCPKAIVAKAQHWVPDIQAHPDAIEGACTVIDHDALWAYQFTSDDVILCRNTFPLLGIAQRLRKAGVMCVVEGNSGRAIIALASKWGDDIMVGQLLVHLKDYRKEMAIRWTSKNQLDKLEAMNERVDSLEGLADGMELTTPVRKLVNRIEDLFGNGEDKRDILRLCTIHRSKGREWDRVFWIGPNVYQPSKWAKKDWEILQEDNLCYVAVTRAKKELITVQVPVLQKKDEDDPDWWEL